MWLHERTGDAKYKAEAKALWQKHWDTEEGKGVWNNFGEPLGGWRWRAGSGAQGNGADGGRGGLGSQWRPPGAWKKRPVLGT